MIEHYNYSSPIGGFKLTASQLGLCKVQYQKNLKTSNPPVLNLHLQKTIHELDLYFAGKLKFFSVPLDFKGTPFRKKVWRELLKISFGKTRSYGEIAKKIKSPLAARAVGAACGTNPLALIVPCHRVLGKNKQLTGFAFGVDKKSWLLKHEEAFA